MMISLKYYLQRARRESTEEAFNRRVAEEQANEARDRDIFEMIMAERMKRDTEKNLEKKSKESPDCRQQ